jgi:hypothetical protein
LRLRAAMRHPSAGIPRRVDAGQAWREQLLSLIDSDTGDHEVSIWVLSQI